MRCGREKYQDAYERLSRGSRQSDYLVPRGQMQGCPPRHENVAQPLRSEVAGYQ
jgi:hypothetical protein